MQRSKQMVEKITLSYINCEKTSKPAVIRNNIKLWKKGWPLSIKKKGLQHLKLTLIDKDLHEVNTS